MTVTKNNNGSYSFIIEPLKKEKEKKEMTLEIGQEKKFEYNEDISHDLNFDKWYRWNCREKEIYKQEPYSKQQGRNIFNNIWGAHTYKN